MGRAGRPWLALGAYVALFAALLGRLVAAASESFGRGNNPVDSRLLAWTQAAVSRRLLEDPGRLFDAPIFHPAPAQLAGAEAFFSSQLLFAPVFWATGNPVLAANALVAASYPIAAFAMERLLAALGAAPLVGWTGGLLFALGPLAVPANIQITQYLTFYPPLVALAVLRLRQRATWGRAAAFATVFLLAITSSYYMAVFACLVAGGWVAIELSCREEGRGEFLRKLLPAGAAALAILLGISQPYVQRRADAEDVAARRAAARAVRPEGVAAAGAVVAREVGPGAAAVAAAGADGSTGGAASGVRAAPPGRSPAPDGAIAAALARHGIPPLAVRLLWPPGIDLSLVLALAGLAAIGGSPVARRLAAAGVVFAVLGTGLLLALVTGAVPRLPAVLGFFRNGFRLTAITGFGVALLAAAALERARAALGPRPGAALALAVAVAAVATRGRALVSPTLDSVAPVATQSAVYRRVAEVARGHGGGPLLELPATGTKRDLVFTDAMVASAMHGLPLVTGFGPVFPLHWPLVAAAIDGLPAAESLQELVDLTGLRWVLVRPEADWDAPEARAAALSGLASLAAERVDLDGFVLLRIDLPARHPEWARALGRGYRAGESLLGTPYRTLGDGATGHLASLPSARAEAGRLLWLAVEVANRGKGTWPGSLTKNGGADGEVFVAARWWPAAGPEHAGADAAPWGSDVGLRRDLPPGETLQQGLVLPVPHEPGDYRLELYLAQRGRAAAISGEAAAIAVHVTPPA